MKNLLELLERTAAARPDAVAFADEDEAFTWAQALQAARRAGTALAARGAGGRSVALYFDHQARCLPAMLAVLAGGGFYTVLDTAQPAGRAGRILARLRPALLLTDAAHADAARAVLAGQDAAPPLLLWEDACRTPADDAALAAVRAAALDTDLAYVLFTSGSTGEPKGVAVPHRSVLAYSAWAAQAFGIGPENVFGSQTPFYFSMSVTDFYVALRTGARVEVLARRLFSFPVPLLDALRARGVNTIYWVPSAMGIVANWKALDYTALPPLRTILFAGEVMPAARLNYWRAHYPAARFANLYGPTETTDICAYYEVDRPFADDEPLPIGRACDNCGLLLLRDGRAAAPGEEGELCARGSFLALGYYGMPDQTAERFVQNPLQPNYPETIYRTGDLARRNERGELLYCGRIDHQIKHMGYRIEPGEVETAAYGQEKLDACACLYDAATDRLVLFYQGKTDLEAPLRQRLAARLPAYMRPALYCRVRRMPENANGKIDRKVLQAQLET